MSYYWEEVDSASEQFDLEEIVEFQSRHTVSVVFGEDYQFECYIDGFVYYVGLSFIGALVYGIQTYKTRHNG